MTEASARKQEILDNIYAEVEDVEAGIKAIGDGMVELAKLGYLGYVNGVIPHLTATRREFRTFQDALNTADIFSNRRYKLTEVDLELMDLASRADVEGLVSSMVAAGIPVPQRLRNKV